MNQEIKVEKGIPIPSKTRGAMVAALRLLTEVGDSIVFKGNQSSFRGVASNLGIEVVTRKTETEGEFRVWRTA